VLDRFVAQVALNGARIDAVIRQFVTAAMPQHVRMDFHVEARRAGSSLRLKVVLLADDGEAA
jgi:hypothetical protein